MAKLKVTIRNQESQKTKDGTFNVKIRFTHKQKTRYLGTDYYVREDQIESDGTICNHDNAGMMNIQLRSLLNLYEGEIIKLGGQVKAMEMRSILSHLKGIDPYGRDDDFMFFASKILEDKKSEESCAYRKSIEYTIETLIQFCGSEVLLFSEVTAAFLEKYSKNLKNKGLSPNTIAIHLRNIRALYNKAIDADKVSFTAYPFRKFKFRQERTRKRDLTAEEVRLIRDLELASESKARARDITLLSFYLVGMNFKDMLYAKNSDVIRGRLEYSRAKTGRLYSIKIEPEAQAIIDKYSGKEFLLSILENKLKTAKENRSTEIHKDIISQTNKQIKKIAKDNNLEQRVSTYYLRHSWATIASSIGIPKDDISAALGHGL